MPSNMKLIGRFSNGVGAILFVILALDALIHGALVSTLFWLVVAGLAAFNLYVVEKFVSASADERFGANMGVRTPESVVRHHGS